MNYSLFLFYNLIKLYDAKFEQLEYDLQFEQLPSLYTDFALSSFNDSRKGEYDCIIEYLKNKYRRH
jgi:hypothetical protein